LEALKDVAARNKQAGWFTFVLADATGRLVNVEGSPERVTVHETAGRLVRIGYGTTEMAGADAKRHPRCISMDALLDQTKGHTNVPVMQRNFGDPSRGICVGKNTIDMMVFDTTNRGAYLSRGAEYGVSWREYRFAKR
jgi:hypothetical protein